MPVQSESTAKVTATPLGDLTVATGKTVIVDPVIAKIAGIAAREVPGVFALGGGAARIVGAVRGALGNTDLSQGVKVEVGETQVAADVTIVVEYPLPLMGVAEAVRAAVAAAITDLKTAFDAAQSDPDVAAFGAVGAAGVPQPSIPAMGQVWSDWGATQAALIAGSAGDPTAAWQKMADSIAAKIKG